MAKSMEDVFKEALLNGMLGQTLTKCSRWATKRRVMGEPFPGPYGYKYHPWCRGIHDSEASFNSVMKAAQMGVTEVAINRAFFSVDILKRSVLYVLPTAVNAGDFSKTRFNAALIESPYLKSIFTDTNREGLKQAGGVSLYIRGSRGDSNLKSIPVSTLILDELDEMDQDQIWLALERLSGHIEKSVWSLSTPTMPKFGIHKQFLMGTQEHFRFKCPHCDKRTELIFPECVEIIGEAVTDPRCKESFLKCKECNHMLDHEAKPRWLEGAYWEATEKAVDEDHRSFYVNQLYSFTVSPKELAQAYFRGLADEGAMVEFQKSKLGLPYIPAGGMVTDTEIEESLRNHTKADPRPSVGRERMIVMGVDQGKWNHVVVMEYFFDTPSRDLNVAAFGKLLWEGKMPGDRFCDLDLLMREWQVLGCVIDADPEANEARRFARRFPGYVHLCRYRRGQTGKEIQVSEAESGAPIATVDRTNWLDASQGRFHTARIHTPRDLSYEFKEHMKNVVRTYEMDELNNPRAVYRNTSADHFVHALNYAEIALPLATAYTTNRDISDLL